MADLVVLAWVDFQPRTQGLAADLGGEVHFVKSHDVRDRRMRAALIPVRYLQNAVATWRVLRRNRPKAVIVVSPPVFAPVVAFLWARLHGSKLVMDCHTPAFHSRKWGWSLPIHRWLARRIDAVTLHTDTGRAEVASWGARAIFLPDDLPTRSEGTCQPASTRPRVVMAGSLDELEPVEEEIKAARLLPDVDVVFTGNYDRLPRKLLASAPSNAIFTGWLPHPLFLEELQTADVVAGFCTDPLAVNRVAYEALGLSRPLVLSDLAAVRHRFGQAPLFCPNQPRAMADTIRRALADAADLSARSDALQAELRADREVAVDQVRKVLGQFDRPAPARVLVISQHDYPSHPVLRRNVDHLVGAGISVDVVCTREKRVPDVDSPQRLRLFQINMQHRRFSSIGYPFEYLAFFLRALPRILRLSFGPRYDTVQVDTVPDLHIFGALPAKWRGARLVLFMYELMPELTASRVGCGQDHPIIRLLRWLERLAIRSADQVIIVNEPCRRILIERGVPESKVTVVLNTPLEVPRGQLDTAENPIIITHATLVERYGVQVLIEAVALLADSWPTLKLEVLGSGEYRPALEQLAERLGVRERVDFVGFVPWLDALTHIRRARLGIVPVIDDGYSHLLLPTKLFDYVAQGIPAVSSRLATVLEYFPPGSVTYFEPGDATGLSACINSLLIDSERASRQAAKASEILSRMEWTREAERYLDMLGVAT